MIIFAIQHFVHLITHQYVANFKIEHLFTFFNLSGKPITCKLFLKRG